ncbi:glycosyltransferase family 61 protein [Pontimonas sp.]|nr:glycosyltransferase family 61 protein [Pontimonas sp.]
MDILPPNLSGFKDVIFCPPILFESVQPAIATFRSAKIVGRNPIALDCDGNLIQESLFRTSDRNKLAVSYLRLEELLAVRKFPDRKAGYIEGRVCLLSSFWDTFGHWIPEHLLKVREVLQHDPSPDTVRFLIRGEPTDFKTQLLLAAGIRQENILFWDRSFATVEELVVPRYPQVSRGALDWVKSLMLPEPVEGGRHRIYLSRQKQPYRTIANEGAVQSVLDEFGVLTVFPEEMSFSEQVITASQASVFFGPQGSAFTLQIFAANAAIVEAFPRDRVHLFNRQVALVKQHRHFALADPRGPVPRALADKSVVVDVGQLREALTAACQEGRDQP